MIKIEISAHYAPDVPGLRKQVDEAMEAIGFRREVAVLERPHWSPVDVKTQPPVDAPAVDEAQARYAPEAELPAEAQAAKAETKPAEAEAPKPARRARAPKDEPKAAPAPAAEPPAISTGEARVGPQDPPEVQEQDAADEAAETAATRKAPATADDVRAALGDYVTKFGMAAAQEDGQQVLRRLFGEGIAKISEIPAGAENFAKAVAGMKEMTAKNPFKREAV